MAHGYVIPVIIILVLIIALILTGYIYDPIVVVPSVAIIGFLSYRIVYVIAKTRKRNLYTYKGKIGKAIEDIPKGKMGYVLVEGEYWEAVALEDIKKDETVVVEDMRDLKLLVKKNINETIV
ncbi:MULTISPECIES: NfeD family protein [Metallosphaera]|uniref:Serine protease n=2 Tax=Metallosphaera TaxID=41980 RepID=A0A0K1T5B8_9CREN|nr:MULTISPECIES: NfeD family protein [Metallosphaera]AKV75276.1 serine protease [Metallosphaera sedula]AKV77516.1 serine protease [Metallosphaera sedula]AKV79763.1 serine protease [Metallosphaera sedula]AKV82008.1 serine protease [Metallosphaera sedula]AKV84241.1 serine protease [Metallosphaera sedula]